MIRAYLGLGANLGQAQDNLLWAIERLRVREGVQVVRCSSFYRSAPVDATGPDYLNAVLEIETSLSAPLLLRELQDIESAGGRRRPYRNAPRMLDLDLLLYGSGRISSPQLEVPHPRMHERAFVLLPLAELDDSLVCAEQLRSVAHQDISRL